MHVTGSHGCLTLDRGSRGQGLQGSTTAKSIDRSGSDNDQSSESLHSRNHVTLTSTSCTSQLSQSSYKGLVVVVVSNRRP